MICGPDSAHAEKGWRGRGVPTVPITTTRAYSYRVPQATSKFSLARRPTVFKGKFDRRHTFDEQSQLRYIALTVIEFKWIWDNYSNLNLLSNILCCKAFALLSCDSYVFLFFFLMLLFFVLSEGVSHICVPCICDLKGTVTGSVCDSITGQCVCVPTRYGKDCSSCRPGECVLNN